MTTSDVKKHWEDRYAERDRIWSGRVNHWLAEIAGTLRPGRALDLGCGEGGDSVWLAEHGWQVVGVDISDTALARAAAEAARRGLSERVEFLQMNLSEQFPEGSFDLVSAQFLQSLVHLDRERIFAAAARAVAPGGTLLVVDHGAAPPWAQHIHDHVFPSVDEVLATIPLEGPWERVRVGSAERDAVGPDGQRGVLLDNLIVLRRSAA
ncbi:methylase involved in ubiquinone/menaquinone biosynthesis [Mycolicibacterium chubuense NBB4]|uniref:Methylase involved in ubiquinone/menaquinone biosynthesis n=1 Tax=Mycolicibacterium chubuense (strain NBB4) TaxID=710421 RepID=I4BL38_MYCCN|nr:class I SAM-dependent methyltransferase [Mycolicibacterium chubuense]AFM17995.1 methylase involved in ubiquinone/menaquinone biosynthesis [Mycolicibacterium chubuense NBB4]